MMESWPRWTTTQSFLLRACCVSVVRWVPHLRCYFTFSLFCDLYAAFGALGHTTFQAEWGVGDHLEKCSGWPVKCHRHCVAEFSKAARVFRSCGQDGKIRLSLCWEAICSVFPGRGGAAFVPLNICMIWITRVIYESVDDKVARCTIKTWWGRLKQLSKANKTKL